LLAQACAPKKQLFFRGKTRDRFLRKLPRGVVYLADKRPGNRWVELRNLRGVEFHVRTAPSLEGKRVSGTISFQVQAALYYLKNVVIPNGVARREESLFVSLRLSSSFFRHPHQCGEMRMLRESSKPHQFASQVFSSTPRLCAILYLLSALTHGHPHRTQTRPSATPRRKYFIAYAGR
jgi:hypothetical protein